MGTATSKSVYGPVDNWYRYAVSAENVGAGFE